MRELTIEQLRKILTDNGVDYFVVDNTDGIVKINFLVKDEVQKQNIS